MMKWINTEVATIEKARELLANRISDLPIFVRWYRTYDGGNTGTPWGRFKEYCTCELIGVTAKRVKVKELAGGVFSVDPRFCYFAHREERKLSGEVKA